MPLAGVKSAEKGSLLTVAIKQQSSAMGTQMFCVAVGLRQGCVSANVRCNCGAQDNKGATERRT
jgi:hypothetical protein